MRSHAVADRFKSSSPSATPPCWQYRSTNDGSVMPASARWDAMELLVILPDDHRTASPIDLRVVMQEQGFKYEANSLACLALIAVCPPGFGRSGWLTAPAACANTG